MGRLNYVGDVPLRINLLIIICYYCYIKFLLTCSLLSLLLWLYLFNNSVFIRDALIEKNGIMRGKFPNGGPPFFSLRASLITSVSVSAMITTSAQDIMCFKGNRCQCLDWCKYFYLISIYLKKMFTIIASLDNLGFKALYSIWIFAVSQNINEKWTKFSLTWPWKWYRRAW